MNGQVIIGLFYCDVTRPAAEKAAKVAEILSYAKGLPGVVLAKNLMETSVHGQETISREIAQNRLTRLVLVGDMPGLWKSFFVKAATACGISPQGVVLASFVEHGITIESAPDRAKAVVACAVLGISYHRAAQPEQTSVEKRTLVIGGGIAGIQAGLEIANAGYPVTIVEKTGTIGGKMARFDKTFPTMDCAACILTPKMVDIGQNPNIDVLTLSRVIKVEGGPGNFKVTIRRKSRHIDLETCTGCGICAEKCPGKAPSDFDFNLKMRTAAHIPFPQAVPNKFMIDEESCLFFKTGKCRACEKVCPAKAIRLDEKERDLQILVGNIVVASGYQIFDPTKIEYLGYGKFDNVITALQFERMVNSSGPTGGQIRLATRDRKGNRVFSADGPEPKAVAIVHCVGSRDRNYNRHCSTVCCMYSLKFAHLVKEKIHDCDVYEYFIDLRAFGKGYEEFLDRVRKEEINLIRGRTARIEASDGRLMVKTEDMIGGGLLNQKVDMVILAVGMEPGNDYGEISSLLGIERSEGGFFRERDKNLDPVGTIKGGIYLAGTCQGPKDIPDTVTHASAAAGRVLQNLSRGSLALDEVLTLPEIEKRARYLAGGQ